MDGGDKSVRGRLFSFEGIDGVGKTTQVARVKDWLEQEGYRVQVVREPGGTPWGEAIRDVLLHRASSRDATAEFLLFAAARAELVRAVICPWLDQGGVVLADRYIDSSEAYQGWGGGGDLRLIRLVNDALTEKARPMGTLWLDGVSRGDRSTQDNLESRGKEFFDRVLEGYGVLWQSQPQRIRRIDSNRDQEEVFQSIRVAVDEWLRAQDISPTSARKGGRMS